MEHCAICEDSKKNAFGLLLEMVTPAPPVQILPGISVSNRVIWTRVNWRSLFSSKADLHEEMCSCCGSTLTEQQSDVTDAVNTQSSLWCCPWAMQEQGEDGYLCHSCCCTGTSTGWGSCPWYPAHTARVQGIWHFWTDTWPHLYLQRRYLRPLKQSKVKKHPAKMTFFTHWLMMWRAMAGKKACRLWIFCY